MIAIGEPADQRAGVRHRIGVGPSAILLGDLRQSQHKTGQGHHHPADDDDARSRTPRLSVTRNIAMGGKRAGIAAKVSVGSRLSGRQPRPAPAAAKAENRGSCPGAFSQSSAGSGIDCRIGIASTAAMQARAKPIRGATPWRNRSRNAVAPTGSDSSSTATRAVRASRLAPPRRPAAKSERGRRPASLSRGRRDARR